MARTPQPQEPGIQAPPLNHEADIGSGERTPAQKETDEMIKQVPMQPGGNRQSTDQPAQPGQKPPQQ